MQEWLSVEVSWLSQNLKVSHAAETGSKANCRAFPGSSRVFRAWAPPWLRMRWGRNELGAMGAKEFLTFFHISANMEICEGPIRSWLPARPTASLAWARRRVGNFC